MSIISNAMSITIPEYIPAEISDEILSWWYDVDRHWIVSRLSKKHNQKHNRAIFFDRLLSKYPLSDGMMGGEIFSREEFFYWHNPLISVYKSPPPPPGGKGNNLGVYKTRRDYPSDLGTRSGQRHGKPPTSTLIYSFADPDGIDMDGSRRWKSWHIQIPKDDVDAPDPGRCEAIVPNPEQRALASPWSLTLTFFVIKDGFGDHRNGSKK